MHFTVLIRLCYIIKAKGLCKWTRERILVDFVLVFRVALVTVVKSWNQCRSALMDKRIKKV